MSDAARAIVRANLERSLVAEGIVQSERLLSYRAKFDEAAKLLRKAIGTLKDDAPLTALAEIDEARALIIQGRPERIKALGLNRTKNGEAK